MPLLSATSEVFVQEVLRSMPSYPTYFHHMRAINQRGPRVLGELPRLAPLTPEKVRVWQERGEAWRDAGYPVARDGEEKGP